MKIFLVSYPTQSVILHSGQSVTTPYSESVEYETQHSKFLLIISFLSRLYIPNSAFGSHIPTEILMKFSSLSYVLHDYQLFPLT